MGSGWGKVTLRHQETTGVADCSEKEQMPSPWGCRPWAPGLGASLGVGGGRQARLQAEGQDRRGSRDTCTKCVPHPPPHPVVPAGYVEWSKPRLLRRIAELEKVSVTCLFRTCLCEGSGVSEGGGQAMCTPPPSVSNRGTLARGDSCGSRQDLRAVSSLSPCHGRQRGSHNTPCPTLVCNHAWASYGGRFFSPRVQYLNFEKLFVHALPAGRVTFLLFSPV